VAIAAANLLFQQVAEARAARRRIGRAIALNGFRFLVYFLRLDRERNRARLAVDTRELRLDLLAFLEDGARVFHPIAPELRGTQLALDAVAEVDDRATRVDFLHGAADDRALRVLGDVRGERILGELLDTERDALALRIDRQHHRFELLALLVVAHRLFAR